MSQPNYKPITPVSVDQLASHMATTSIAEDSNGQWAYFPPGTSLDEQLLILAGVEDYKLTDSASPTISSTSSNLPRQNSSNFDLKQAMSAHLSMLQDQELASMLDTAMHLNSSSPSTTPTFQFEVHAPTPPSSPPPFMGYQPSYPPGSLHQLVTLYTTQLPNCTSLDDLADAPLPSSNEELDALSQYIVQVIGRMVEEGGLAVRSPKAHPCYPHWVEGSEKKARRESELEELVYENAAWGDVDMEL
jgi:hypothetical protein